MQRHGVGLAPNVSRNHRHGTKFAHGAGIAQNDAINQAPFHVGQRNVPKGLPATGAQHNRGLFFVGSLGLHQRNQLAGNKREGDEYRRQNNPRDRKNDLDVMRLKPRAQPALRAKDQHVNQAGDHR